MIRNAAHIGNHSYRNSLGDTVSEKREAIYCSMVTIMDRIKQYSGKRCSFIVLDPVSLEIFENGYLMVKKTAEDQTADFYDYGTLFPVSHDRKLRLYVAKERPAGTMLFGTSYVNSDPLHFGRLHIVDFYNEDDIGGGNLLSYFENKVRSDVDKEELQKIFAYCNEGTLTDQANHWIETAAYYIWLEEGCPDGKDQEHWDRAYRMFLDRPDNQ